MGRLGFNLVRQKEAPAKEGSVAVNVEGGATDQQNERNENVEISELLLIIEERNRTIKNLRLMLASLTTVIVCLCAYIVLTQSKAFRGDQEVAPSDNEVKAFSQQVEALKGDYNVLNQARLEQEQNCSEKEKAWLADQQRLNLVFTAQNAKFAELQDTASTLRAEHQALIIQCRAREDELQAEVKKLSDERASRELARSQRQRKTTTTTTTTTTEAPARKGLVGEQFQKIHELMKDIESDGQFRDMQELIKKTDEIFGL